MSDKDCSVGRWWGSIANSFDRYALTRYIPQSEGENTDRKKGEVVAYLVVMVYLQPHSINAASIISMSSLICWTVGSMPHSKKKS
jgi:hypothetical protein